MKVVRDSSMQDESRQAMQLVNHQFSYETEPQVNQSYPELKLFKSRASVGLVGSYRV